MTDISQSEGLSTHRCPHCSYLQLMVRARIPLDRVDEIGNCSTRRLGPFHSGDFIFRDGDRSGAIYIVQSGAVKTQYISFEGDLQVSGFYLAGEIFGLDDTGEKVHRSDAIALERTWICEISLDRLESICAELPLFQHEILGLYGQQLRHTRGLWINNRNVSAEERIFCFLKDLYQRTTQRLGNVTEIRLPMRKSDIASFLSLTPEHLSRVLHEFEQAGLIRNHFRTIEYLDPQAFTTRNCAPVN
ncbi:MAG: helix-turn-helix domain-containing protein [Gammaproteobacteria bacterium]